MFINSKDLTIIKLYLWMIGKRFDYSSSNFLNEAFDFLIRNKSKLNIILDPLISFNFSQENIN